MAVLGAVASRPASRAWAAVSGMRLGKAVVVRRPGWPGGAVIHRPRVVPAVAPVSGRLGSRVGPVGRRRRSASRAASGIAQARRSWQARQSRCSSAAEAGAGCGGGGFAEDSRRALPRATLQAPPQPPVGRFVGDGWTRPEWVTLSRDPPEDRFVFRLDGVGRRLGGRVRHRLGGGVAIRRPGWLGRGVVVRLAGHPGSSRVGHMAVPAVGPLARVGPVGRRSGRLRARQAGSWQARRAWRFRRRAAGGTPAPGGGGRRRLGGGGFAADHVGASTGDPSSASPATASVGSSGMAGCVPE